MRRSSKRPWGAEHRPLDPQRLRGMARTEEGPGGVSFTVRQVRNDARSYTCPGCNHAIAPGVAHVVAWSNEHLFGAEAALAERRHWHLACWRRAT
ncbi:MAG: hypothetical protein GX427_08615 [Actinomycetales bacterium]|nr:hypothetical protein [Actinomycetales bacterium]